MQTISIDVKQVLIHMNKEGFVMEKGERRECISFDCFGQTLFGIIHRPLHRQKAPAVLFCSGFDGNKCGKHRIYVRLAEELAKRGILVLRFDYRGSGDSEGDFDQITIESKIEDALAALDYLKKDSQVKIDRMAILGRSLGGAIAVKAASRAGDICSLALWAPLYSSQFWRDLCEASTSQALTEEQMAQVWKYKKIPNCQFLEQFFALDLSSDLDSLEKVPMLFVHSDKDSIVKVEHTENYLKQRQNSLEHTKFLRLSDTEHDFSDLKEQELAIGETIRWFGQTLFRDGDQGWIQ